MIEGDQMIDLLIANGTVVDGSGQPAYLADVAISGERIVSVGDLGHVEATRTIDATGMVVSPGFIDIHTHSDLTLLIEPFRHEQGSTRRGPPRSVGTVGTAPTRFAPDKTDEVREMMSGLHGEEVDWAWTDLAGVPRLRSRTRARHEHRATARPMAPCAVRWSDSKIVEPPLTTFRRCSGWLPRAMEQGAYGLSTGLTLTPSAYGDTDEVVALAEVMSHFPGRFYTSHTRFWAGLSHQGRCRSDRDRSASERTSAGLAHGN